MAVTTLVRNNTMGELTLRDGTPLPVSLLLAFEKGDTTLSGLLSGGKLNEPLKVTRRGKLLSTMRGDRVYPTGSFSSWLTEIGDAAGTLVDFLMKRGLYATNIGTRGAGELYTLDLQIRFKALQFGAKDETLLLEDVLFSGDIAEAFEGNTFALSYEVLGRVVLDGVVLAEEIT